MFKKVLLTTSIALALSASAMASDVSKLIVGPVDSLSEYETSSWYSGEKKVGDYVVLEVNAAELQPAIWELSTRYEVTNAALVNDVAAIGYGEVLGFETSLHAASLDDFNDPQVEFQFNLQWENHDILEGMSNVREKKHTPVVAVFADGSTSHEDVVYSGGYNFASGVEDYRSAGGECFFDKGLNLAGVIGAQQNNNIGITGMADVDIYMAGVETADCESETYIQDPAAIFEALNSFTADDGETGAPVPDVILITQGFEAPCPTSTQNVIDELVTEGVTIVVSAGDDSDYSGSFYPANCSNVILVAGTEENGSVTANGNLSTSIDVTAPGLVYTTSSIGYITKEGSDFAAASVAGMVAMMKSNYPDASPEEIESAIKASALQNDNAECLTSNLCGEGHANAKMLMNYAHSVYDPEIEFTHAFTGDSCPDEAEVEALSEHMNACAAYVADVTTSYALASTNSFEHFGYQFKLIKRPEGVSVWYNNVNPSTGVYSEGRDNGIKVVSSFSYDEERANDLLLPLLDVDAEEFDYAIASCLPVTADTSEWDGLGKMIGDNICFEVAEIDVSSIEVPAFCD
jgi:hypothetical protein